MKFSQISVVNLSTPSARSTSKGDGALLFVKATLMARSSMSSVQDATVPAAVRESMPILTAIASTVSIWPRTTELRRESTGGEGKCACSSASGHKTFSHIFPV